MKLLENEEISMLSMTQKKMLQCIYEIIQWAWNYLIFYYGPSIHAKYFTVINSEK